MKLSVNLVAGGKYVRAGDELPPDFVLPPHLDRFAIHDEPPQTSRAASRFSSAGHQGNLGASGQLAKPAMSYPESEEEFTSKFAKKKGKGL
jgi:hypothetical protein